MTPPQRPLALLAGAAMGCAGLQSVPENCRVAEAPAGPERQAAVRIVAELDESLRRGPLVATAMSDGTALLATALSGIGGTMDDAAVWVVHADQRVTAANAIADGLTGFDFEPLDAAVLATSAPDDVLECAQAVAEVTPTQAS